MFPRTVWLQIQDQALAALALDGRRLTWLERVPLPPGLIEAGEPQQLEAVGDLIGDLLIERGFAGARVTAVLPAAATDWRLLVWPDGQAPEDPLPLPLLRQLQAQLGLALELEEVDLELLPRPGRPAEALLVVARRSLLQAWIDCFTSAGVALDALEAGPVCLCRAAEPLVERPLAALVELRPEATELVLLENGWPVLQRRLPAALDPSALALQVQRSLRYWHLQSAADGEAASLWQALLHGPEAESPELAAALASALGCPTQVLDPLALGWWERPDPAPEPAADAATPRGTELALLWGLAAAEPQQR
jgi:hypothetical protein